MSHNTIVTIVIPTETQPSAAHEEKTEEEAEGRLLCWGAGGFGGAHETETVVEAKDSLVQLDFGVRLVACGNSHGILVTDDNAVYTWGSGDYGRLGENGDSKLRRIQLDPDQTSPPPVLRVACGSDRTFVVLESGLAFSLGHDTAPHEGSEPSEALNQVTPHPLKTLLPKKVKDVACGEKHTLFLFTDGQLGSVGDNSNGQLGTGKKESEESVTVLSTPRNIVAIACGNDHSLAVTDDGELYVWGLGEACGSRTGDLARPTPVHCGKRQVHAVAGGQTHSLALTEDGCVYSWGTGEDGQLGHGPDVKYLTGPRRIRHQDLDHKTVQIQCGPLYSIALTVTGDVFIWGQNKSHVIDPLTCHTAVYYEPCMVDVGGRKVRSVACGACHLAAVTGQPAETDWPPEINEAAEEDSEDELVEEDIPPDNVSEAAVDKSPAVFVSRATPQGRDEPLEESVTPATQPPRSPAASNPVQDPSPLQLLPHRTPLHTTRRYLSPRQRGSPAAQRPKPPSTAEPKSQNESPSFPSTSQSTVGDIGDDVSARKSASAKKRVQFNPTVEEYNDDDEKSVSFREVNQIVDKYYAESPRQTPDFHDDLKYLHQLRAWSKYLRNEPQPARQFSRPMSNSNYLLRGTSALSNTSLQFAVRKKAGPRPLGSARTSTPRRSKTWSPSASRSSDFVVVDDLCPSPDNGPPRELTTPNKLFGAFHPLPLLNRSKDSKSAAPRLQRSGTFTAPLRPRTQVIVMNTLEPLEQSSPSASIPDKRKEIDFTLDTRTSDLRLQRSRTFDSFGRRSADKKSVRVALP